MAAFAALLVLGVVLILIGQAIDDGDEGEVTEDAPASTVTPHAQPDAEECGIEVPEIAGTSAAPVCSLGFGIAIPDGWNATRLDEQSLERLANAPLSRPSFLPAARTVADTGADFYAAGVEEGGAVSELKVDVRDGADTSRQAIESEAWAVVDDPRVGDAQVVFATGDRTRVDYQLTLPSAETGDDIEVSGSQLLVADGDRLWSLIVTAEDEARRDELVEIFTTSLTFV